MNTYSVHENGKIYKISIEMKAGLRNTNTECVRAARIRTQIELGQTFH